MSDDHDDDFPLEGRRKDGQPFKAGNIRDDGATLWVKTVPRQAAGSRWVTAASEEGAPREFATPTPTSSANSSAR